MNRKGKVVVDTNVAAFLKVLDPRDKTTGGGTASAVAGAMAGGLVAMVARLSIGKPGMASEGFYEEIATAATSISDLLFDGGYEDSRAFEAVRSAYRLAKATDEEKAERDRAVQAAWTYAARVPLENAESCARVLELGGRLQGRSNLNAASDLICAIHLARAGLLGCVANVEINLPSIKDRNVAAQMAVRLDALREQAEVYAPLKE